MSKTTTKRIFSIALIVTASLIVAIMVTMLGAQYYSAQAKSYATNASTGTLCNVLDTPTEVRDYLQRRYQGKNSLTITAGTEIRLDRANINQEIMNWGYEQTTGTIVNSTCSEVACTMLMKSHGQATNLSNINTFIPIMDIAIENGYWNSGTSSTSVDNLVTKSFRHFGNNSKKGNNDYLSVYNTLKNQVNSNKSVIFSSSQHSMQGVGYVTYTVKYKTKILGFNKTVTVEEDFIIVNDGWYTASYGKEQFSYYPAVCMGITHTVLTKVV